MSVKKQDIKETVPPSMKPEQAIHLIQKQIERIEEIRTLKYDDPKVDAWLSFTVNILNSVFGQPNGEYERRTLDIAHPSGKPIRIEMSDVERHRNHVNRCDKRKALLVSYVEQLQSLYPVPIATGSSEQDFCEHSQPATEGHRELDINPDIYAKCHELFEGGHFPEAVEKSFKVVRDRLRQLTGYETGSEAFGKGGLHIRGASAHHVDSDFNEGVKFLTMAIDRFRNEKSHTSDVKIEDKTRAYEYLRLSSLAMNLLSNAEVS